MNQAQQEQFLEHMREGMRRGAAAAAMGFTRRDVLDFIAENKEFERAVLDAEGEASEHVEEALYQAAISGSVAACKLWLDLRKPAGANLPAVMPSLDPEDEGDGFDALLNLTR